MTAMVWSYMLAGFGILSLHLTGKKLRIGWAVGLFNSGLWVIYALTSQQYGFIISSVFFIIVQFNNYMKWGVKEGSDASRKAS